MLGNNPERARGVFDQGLHQRGRMDASTNPSNNVRKVIDDGALAEIIADIKKKRPRALSNEEALDIILLQAKLRNEHFKMQKKVGHCRTIKSACVTNRVAQMLNRKKELVGKLWKEYMMSREFAISP